MEEQRKKILIVDDSEMNREDIRSRIMRKQVFL